MLNVGGSMEIVEPDYKKAFGQLAFLVGVATVQLQSEKTESAKATLENAVLVIDKVYNGPEFKVPNGT